MSNDARRAITHPKPDLDELRRAFAAGETRGDMAAYFKVNPVRLSRIIVRMLSPLSKSEVKQIQRARAAAIAAREAAS